jgi:Flp pilus assembly protein TadD
MREIAAAVSAADFQRASDLADMELSRGAIHPALFNVRALLLERQQRDEEALAEYQRARALSPKDAAILNAIGLCFTRLYRLEEAIAVFDEAIRYHPTYTPSYYRKGIVLGMSGDLEAAAQAHQRAVALYPRSTEALASLASIAARKDEPEKARAFAERALKINPSETTATAALALVDNSERQFERAEQHIRAVLDNPAVVGHGRAVALGILGDALDGQNRFADAFAAYSAENAQLLQLHAARFAGKPRGADLAQSLAAYFETAAAENWRVSSSATSTHKAADRHVFLVGFFRSGTTLLEQVLESHPDIVTLEERDFLAEPAERYLTNDIGLARLAALPAETLTAMRDEYWQRVHAHGLKVEGKVFVDKHPLNTLKLPLILRLFPDARILFAVRDPRDVILSSFRRHFEVNAAMYELLTLDGAARLYDSVMRLAEVLREKLSPPFLMHRYEDMIEDFSGSLHRVCDFLGVPFREEMKEFDSTARLQDIRSPSAQQVRRGLYSDGVGQWRHYSAQLEPVRLLLLPWIERFGYPAD